jgi:signal transduction histidine kinase
MSTAAKFAWLPQDSRTELFPVFEHAPVGLAQCDLQGKLIALNPMLEAMLGRGSIGAQSLCLTDLFHPSERAECEHLFRELVEQRRDSFQIRSKTPADSESVRWTVWRVSGADGEADFAFVLAHYIGLDESGLDERGSEESGSEKSGRRKIGPEHELPRRLRQAEGLETIGRLAGGVAHDFNNLLTGILLYCDLLIGRAEPGHPVRKYAEEIRNASMQATRLVRQLLTIARPTNSALSLLSLNDIAEGMRYLLTRLIGENIELQFHLDHKLGLVKMDSAQLQQILLNLVLNARDAMPGGGHIEIETRNCKLQVLAETGLGANGITSFPCALFAVTDNGSGMDANTQAHMFEAFFTTKASKGTGLGLATVHDIVTRNGGLIYVDSAPSCGTRVSVILPLIPETVLGSQSGADFPTDPNRETLVPKE